MPGRNVDNCLRAGCRPIGHRRVSNLHKLGSRQVETLCTCRVYIVHTDLAGLQVGENSRRVQRRFHG